MDLGILAALRSYLQSLSEQELWALLVDFFIYREVNAAIIHGTAEHGVDVLAYVDRNQDFLHKGYNLLIQAKKGSVSLSRWRNEVLGPLCEARYYPVLHPHYIDSHPRRVLLVLTGNLTQEARAAVSVFNARHDVKIEVMELDEIIRMFEETGFANALLDRLEKVGAGIEPKEQDATPPTVGGDVD